ncbi:hypothetical protein ACJRW5_09950 [Pseudomonas sp. SH1-B]
MRLGELAGRIPGYRIESIGPQQGDTGVTVINQVNGKRFAIAATRIEQLAVGTGIRPSR